jgi:hypothetical protein
MEGDRMFLDPASECSLCRQNHQQTAPPLLKRDGPLGSSALFSPPQVESLIVRNPATGCLFPMQGTVKHLERCNWYAVDVCAPALWRGKLPPGKKSNRCGNGEDEKKNRRFVFYGVACFGYAKPKIDGGRGKP